MTRLAIIHRDILDARAEIKNKKEDVQVIYLEIMYLQQKIEILKEAIDEKNC